MSAATTHEPATPGRHKPIAVTMGDPSGIGPEITLKVAADPDLAARLVIIGDSAHLRRVARALPIDIEVRTVPAPQQAPSAAGTVNVIDAGPPLDDIAIGTVSTIAGTAAFDYVRSAIDLARDGRIAAIVTAPINKEALSAAGIAYPGHTEMLADLGGADRVAMMLANDQLRVVLVTIHCALRDAIAQITVENVLAAIRLAHQGTRRFGVSSPRVAVAGLNPHAGEGGLFGREEIEIITPAIDRARADGIDASGPWPGDTVFMQARRGLFDVVVAQYHDQGLIPIKYLGLENGVNITLGLPFIRTSPDHGTAFDIAGKGIADPASLREAVIQAARLIDARSKATTP